MIDTYLRDILTASSSITSLVSGRIYPITAPEKATLPVVVFQRIGTNRELHHGGSMKAAKSTFQISCIGDTPTQAKTLASAVVVALHGYKNINGSEKIYRSAVLEEIDLFEPEIEDYVVAVDVELTHSEA